MVINTLWAWMGAMGVSPVDGIISPAYNIYRPVNEDISNLATACDQIDQQPDVSKSAEKSGLQNVAQAVPHLDDGSIQQQAVTKLVQIPATVKKSYLKGIPGK